jgi:bidirectional [NiFe] hydrogenase diaphorase subunit
MPVETKPQAAPMAGKRQPRKDVGAGHVAYHYSGDALIEVRIRLRIVRFPVTRLAEHHRSQIEAAPSRVLGVATFYHFFSLAPKGEHSMTVCLGTACYVAGSLGLMNTLEHRCAKAGTTSPDGKVSVGAARCIGACGIAPAVIYDGRIMGRVTQEQLNKELDRIGVK